MRMLRPGKSGCFHDFWKMITAERTDWISGIVEAGTRMRKMQKRMRAVIEDVVVASRMRRTFAEYFSIVRWRTA